MLLPDSFGLVADSDHEGADILSPDRAPGIASGYIDRHGVIAYLHNCGALLLCGDEAFSRDVDHRIVGLEVSAEARCSDSRVR